MYEERDGDIPRIWRENLPPQGLPEATVPEGTAPDTWSEWIACLSPSQRMGFGCVVIVVLSAISLYCVGAATFVLRPLVIDPAAVTPTEFVRPTLISTPTQMPGPTMSISIPKGGTLVATPTQGPIPPREAILVTPPPDIMAKITLTPLPTSTAGPSPTPSATVTRKSGSTTVPKLKP